MYNLRCRLGAWLLKPHIQAMCRHYNNVTVAHKLKGANQLSERCNYIGIGLRYALGIGTSWRKFDDELNQQWAEAREMLEHAKDPL